MAPSATLFTVPGGISIVTMHGKREIGRDMATMLSLRQVFLPFSTPLDPKNPSEQQKKPAFRR